MNIVYNIGIYMLASSVIMVGYVWFRYIQHNNFQHRNISDITSYTEENESITASVAA